MFNHKSFTANQRQGYYPLVVQATCSGYQQPGKRYVRNLYLEFRLSDASVRLIKQKIVTEHGVFTLDEAYGLNAGRNDGDD